MDQRTGQPLTGRTDKPRWFKSSRSAGAGACVETAFLPGGGVVVRDSKDPDGPNLSFSRDAWRGFTADVKEGKLDFPDGA